MTWPADASDWMDVVDHLLVILGAVVLAAVPTWAARRNHLAIKQAAATTDRIKDQVVNSHPEDGPNLRDDIDKANARITRVSDAMDRWEPVLDLVPTLIANVKSLSSQLTDMGERMSATAERLMAEEDRRRIQISDLRDELEHRTGKRHIG